jgi:hypothetical protein
MTMTTATARTVVVLGNHVEGNRDIRIIESGEVYDLDWSAITTYSDVEARIPYEIPAQA